MHRRLWLARGAAGKAQQRHVIAPRGRRGEADRLGQGNAVQFGIMVGGAVKAHDLFQPGRVPGAGHKVFQQARVAQRQCNLRLVDDLAQLSRAQHRHGVDHNRPGLGGRQPAGDHRRIVGRPDQHAVAGLDAIVLDQRMGDTVGPVRQFLVGALPAVADQRRMVAKPTLDHPVGQLHSGIQPIGIVKARLRQFRPLIGRRQGGTGEAIGMSCGTKLAHPVRSLVQSLPGCGITAVASISTLARSSTRATTCTRAIAG